MFQLHMGQYFLLLSYKCIKSLNIKMREVMDILPVLGPVTDMHLHNRVQKIFHLTGIMTKSIHVWIIMPRSLAHAV